MKTNGNDEAKKAPGVYIGGKSWGTRADKLPCGEYDVISPRFKVVKRKGIKDPEKIMAFIQFEVSTTDGPREVYLRAMGFDDVEPIEESYPFDADNPERKLILRVHKSYKDEKTINAYLTDKQ